MNNFLVVLQPMIMILLLVMIGFGMTRRHLLDDHMSQTISAIVVNICNPALIVASVYREGITATRRDVLIGLGTIVATFVFLTIAGRFFPRWIGVKKGHRRVYNLMTVYTNTGFMGIPIAQAILPPNAMLYVVITNIIFALFFYTHGIITLRGKSSGLELKRIINPGTICSILALVLFWFRVPLPEVIKGTITYTGNATVFLTMSLLGASLATTDLREVLRDSTIWKYIAARMIGYPIALVLIMRALKCDPLLTQTLCLMVALPTANLPLIQARKDGYDTGMLAQGILLTTVVSFLTITLIMGLLF